MNKIAKFLLKLYAKTVKKSHEYIIFESGNQFYDNAFALYQYVKANYPQYKIKYLITSKEMKKSAPQHGVDKSEMLNASRKLQLYKYSLKAKYIFFSYNNYWKKLKLQDDTKISFTTHGEFPVKGVWKYYDYLFGPQENKLICVTSTEYTKNLLLEKYPVLKNHDLVIAGMPRNDIMFHSKINKEDFLKTIGVEDNKNKHLIISLTTFKNENKEGVDYFKEEYPIALTEKDLVELNEVLEKNNQILIIKLHHVQDNVIIPENLKNIRFLKNKTVVDLGISLYELYGICDSLMTDYSTAFLAYLQLDRKVGFILADKEKYAKLRSWSIDNFEDMMPGDKIYTKEELIKFFNNLSSKDDPYKAARKDVRDKFCGDYKDQNCKSYADVYFSDK